jgi:hypothetical protein
VTNFGNTMRFVMAAGVFVAAFIIASALAGLALMYWVASAIASLNAATAVGFEFSHYSSGARIASTGHSGRQAPQSMHSSGWM